MESITITIFTATLTAILGPLLVEWIKQKFILKKQNNLLQKSIHTNEEIDKQLEYILEEIKCDRICIAQFHNGGNYYPTGKSIKKFSIFYERISDRARSIKETFQNIPVSLFPKIFSTLYKEGELDIPKCSNNKMDNGLFHIDGKDYKTKSFYIISIKDLNDNFIGLLAISFYEQEHTLTLDEWIFLRQKVGAIGTILTDYLYQN
jgi:hypothetical protein